MTTIIVPFHEHANGRIKRLWNIVKFAAKRNLTITNKDEVGANIIAMDMNKRKLLYAKTASGSSSCLMIDLSNVERCTIKKEYHSINAGNLVKNKLHHFLKCIFLRIVFKNRSTTVSLPMFDAQNEQKGNADQWEAIAKKWETIITKITRDAEKRIA